MSGVRAVVNGRDIELAEGATLADVVDVVCPGARGVAVAVEREVVPRSQWRLVTVAAGARIEVVTAAAGG